MRSSVLVLFAALGLAGCPEQRAAPAAARPGDAAQDDQALIAAVRDALRREVGVDSISRFVDARPAINTRRETDRAALALADFAPDPDRPGEGPPPNRWRTEAIDVVYWVRPGDWPNPRIVGVAWFQGGHQELFFAEVLPP